MKPMLAEPISDPRNRTPETHNRRGLELLHDESYRAIQKADGDRLMVVVEDDRLYGINRKGAKALIPPRIARAFEPFSGSWVFDGEVMPNGYWIFDMPVANDKVSIKTPYSDRRAVLENLHPSVFQSEIFVHLLPSYTETLDKVDLARRVLAANGEGIIFARVDGPYVPGKRTQYYQKWKFWRSVDCFVMEIGIDGKQNFSVGLLDGKGKPREVATVTALSGDGHKVQKGEVVEVTFLYASQDLRLVQPSRPKLRTDKSPDECLLTQLAPVSKEILT